MDFFKSNTHLHGFHSWKSLYFHSWKFLYISLWKFECFHNMEIGISEQIEFSFMPTLRHFYRANFSQNLLVLSSSFIWKCIWDSSKVVGQEDVCLSSFISIWPTLKFRFAWDSKQHFLSFFIRDFLWDPWEKVFILISLFLCVTRLSSCALQRFCCSLSPFSAPCAQSYFDPTVSCRRPSKKYL